MPDSKHMQKRRPVFDKGTKMIRVIFDDFIKLFETPSPLKIAQTELDTARRDLLKAHTAVEYASTMVSYNQQRIERLERFVAQNKQ